MSTQVALWTGQDQKPADLAAPILVGTHALFAQTSLTPSLVIIDEEHRFGVEQRRTPWSTNSQPPHQITMTATPIPRTLARTFYDAQTVAFLEPLATKPKNIQTRLTPDHKLADFWPWLEQQLAHGEQIFLVAPFIEPSTTPGWENIWSAQQLATVVRKNLPHCRLGVLTGQDAATNKQQLLQAMHDHNLDILVATPVIEVGIDIPQVSLMAIFSAERFGLAQLHQLRGRVGRNGQASWCFLIPSPTAPADSADRLAQVAATTNGAQLAELDLQNRGAGQFLGSLQSGWDGLRLADSIDLPLIKLVKNVYQQANHQEIPVIAADATAGAKRKVAAG